MGFWDGSAQFSRDVLFSARRDQAISRRRQCADPVYVDKKTQRQTTGKENSGERDVTTESVSLPPADRPSIA
jgi:hypothetical protein